MLQCRTRSTATSTKGNRFSVSNNLTLELVAFKDKDKDFPYLIQNVGPGADPGVQAVSPQVTVSHLPGGRLPLLSARPVVTSPAAEHHRPLAGTKLYCLMTEAHRCKQLAQGCYAASPRVGFEPATYWSQVQRSTRCTTAPPFGSLISQKLGSVCNWNLYSLREIIVIGVVSFQFIGQS